MGLADDLIAEAVRENLEQFGASVQYSPETLPALNTTTGRRTPIELPADLPTVTVLRARDRTMPLPNAGRGQQVEVMFTALAADLAAAGVTPTLRHRIIAADGGWEIQQIEYRASRLVVDLYCRRVRSV